MSWGQLALALLQVVTAIIAWRRRENALSAAHNQLIAQRAMALALLTDWGVREANRIRTLTDEQLNREIDDLTPKEPGA